MANYVQTENILKLVQDTGRVLSGVSLELDEEAEHPPWGPPPARAAGFPPTFSCLLLSPRPSVPNSAEEPGRHTRLMMVLSPAVCSLGLVIAVLVLSLTLETQCHGASSISPSVLCIHRGKTR